jgi:hypothetical protein
MSEPRAVVIALVIDEDLSLVVKTAEGCRMQNAVAVALIYGAGRARRLWLQPPAALPMVDGIGRKQVCIRLKALGFSRRVKDPFGFAAMVD